MSPAQLLLIEIARKHWIAPEVITGRRRDAIAVRARMDLALCLYARGYSTPQIGRLIKRDHTTVLYYIGHGRRWCKVKPREVMPREEWRAPSLVEITPAKPRALVPYAGAEKNR